MNNQSEWYIIAEKVGKYIYKLKIIDINFFSFLYNYYYDKLNPDINLFNTGLTKEKLLSADKCKI